MFTNKKIIFVCYWPGSGGQFIATMIDKLLNNPSTFRIYENGSVERTATSNFANLVNGTPLGNHANNTRYYKDMFKSALSEYSVVVDFQTYVEPTHILHVEWIQEFFPNSKIISLVPKDDNELQICWNNWVAKNSFAFEKNNINPVPPKYVPDIDTANTLCLPINKIFTGHHIEYIIDTLIDYLESDIKFKQNAINFYKEYLKKQNNQ